MGIFKRIKDWFTTMPVTWCGSKLPPPPRMYHPSESNEIWVRLSVSRKGDNVSIEMYGLEKVNVCLASFLTKEVSYAQEKYNEYKQSPKSEAEFGMSESTKAMLKDFAHKEARKGGKR